MDLTLFIVKCVFQLLCYGTHLPLCLEAKDNAGLIISVSTVTEATERFSDINS